MLVNWCTYYCGAYSFFYMNDNLSAIDVKFLKKWTVVACQSFYSIEVLDSQKNLTHIEYVLLRTQSYAFVQKENINRPPDKSVKLKILILISQPKHMFNLMGKEIMII